jgi:hypothetical protein
VSQISGAESACFGLGSHSLYLPVLVRLEEPVTRIPAPMSFCARSSSSLMDPASAISSTRSGSVSSPSSASSSPANEFDK